MKKYEVSLMAVLVAIVASSFVSWNNSSKWKNAEGMRWYNFNGHNHFQMNDPSWYSPDEDNWPDCSITAGDTYCEIFAQPSDYVEDEPDLQTINNYRFHRVE
jgi:hypothetical protein